MTAFHKEEYKGYTIEIHVDTDAESPREWDNLGRMLCFHGRHTLGDKNFGYTQSDEGSWQDWAERLKKDGAVIVLPLYLYDHSGITMSVGEFDCKWDSGQVGFIFVTREKLLKEYGGKVVTKAILKKAEGVLRGEVETYDHYIRGDVYGYTITDPNGEEMDDACWGFLGDYDDKDYGALAEAKSVVDRETAKCLYTVTTRVYVRTQVRAKDEAEASEMAKDVVEDKIDATAIEVTKVERELNEVPRVKKEEPV